MIIELILFLFSIILIYQYLCNKSKPPGTPPGTFGLPLLGCIPYGSMRFQDMINGYRKKYGETFWMKLGSRNVVCISDYNTIVQAFNNPLIQGRPEPYTVRMSSDGEVNVKGLVVSSGIPWKDVRRFVIRRLRDGGMGKTSILGIILREAEALADDFEKYVGEPTELPWSINAGVLNVIWKLVSDQRYDVGDKEINKLTINITDILIHHQSIFFFLMNFNPWLEMCIPEFMKNLFGKKDFMEKMYTLLQFLEKNVDDHKDALDENNLKDLIDYYLVEINRVTNDTTNQSQTNKYFCENELIHVILDLFMAGSETTSSTIRWYILIMAKYPIIQQKVYEELTKEIPKDMPISLDDKKNLPYFEATINETLRIKLIAPFGVLHVASEDTTISDYFVPKDTVVMANLQAPNRNPKYWKYPDKFYPEHFLNDDMTFNQNTTGFLSFSTGRRICVGENLARMDLYFMLATLIRRFSFSVPEGKTLSLDSEIDRPFFSIPCPFKLVINKR